MLIPELKQGQDALWVIQGMLGKGSYGSVWKVKRHEQCQLSYALKVQPRDPEVAWESCSVFKEWQALQAMNGSPNIVQCYGVLHTTFNVQFLLELFPSTLTAFLDCRPDLDEDFAKVVCACICKGLAKMHQLGLVHRDLKPDNCLVRHQPHLIAAIGDLGSALSQEGVATKCTTPSIKAPEIWFNGGFLRQSDMWCLGLICMKLEHRNVFRQCLREGETWKDPTLGKRFFIRLLCLLCARPQDTEQEIWTKQEVFEMAIAPPGQCPFGDRFSSGLFYAFTHKMLEPAPHKRSLALEMLGHGWLMDLPTII